MSFTKGAEKPALKLIDADRSHQEFFALPDMQGDGVPACGLVLGEILKGEAAISGDIFNKPDVIRRVGPEWFRVAPAVMRLTRVAACGWLVPTKHLIIVRCVAVAHFRVVLGAPDVTFDAEVLLPKLVDQSCKGPNWALFHACPQRTQALGVGLILIIVGSQSRIPLAQRLLFRVGDIAQVGLSHRWHGVRLRQRILQHPGVFCNDAVQLIREIGPQGGIAGKEGLDRDRREATIPGSIVRNWVEDHL